MGMDRGMSDSQEDRAAAEERSEMAGTGQPGQRMIAAERPDGAALQSGPPRLLPLKEFLLHCGLSESTVRRRARDGSLRVVQVGGKGKKLLFPVDALAQSCSPQSSTTPQGKVENTSLTPSTGTPTEKISGPRPRWARHLPRRPQ